MKSDISSKLKKYRTKRGLTQEQLGHEAGLTKDYISKIERGEVLSPSFDTVEKIVKALQIDLNDLSSN